MSTAAITITLLAALALGVLAVISAKRLEKQDALSVTAILVLTGLLMAIEVLPLVTSHVSCTFSKKVALLLEAALVPVWLFCSITFARKPGQWYQTGWFMRGLTLASLLLIVPAVLLVPEQFYYCPDFPNEFVLFLSPIGFFFYVAIMLCLVAALVQFESTFTNASPQALWHLKFFLVGLCLMLAVQVFYYSQALLYRTLNMEYGPFRAFMFLITCLLMIFTVVKRDMTARVTVSHHVAYKSVVLFAVGIYLLLLGGLGEGMRYLSGHFSRSVGVSVAFLTGLGLLLLLLSGRIRRELKVALLKHFYQNKYDYRTQWLLFTEQLSSTDWDRMLQSVLEVYAGTFGVDGAALMLYDERRNGYSLTASCRMELKQEFIAADSSLVAFMQKRGWVYFVRDQVAEVAEENSEFFAANSISFVVPLPGVVRPDGLILLGKMIKPDECYIYEDFDLMKTYARQAHQTIRQHRLAKELLLSREEAAVGNVATFIMHDLKNQLAAISLITENAPRLISNPEYQKDLVVSLQTTVHKMQKLIGNLKTLDKDKTLHVERIELLGLVEDCTLQFDGQSLQLTGGRCFVDGDRAELQKVVMNLLLNALEASAPGAVVYVTVGEDDGQRFVRVRDEGCGMTPQFIQHELFVPFHTTKESGLGIGLFQSRQIVQAHGGRLEVESTPDVGSVFTVWLPESGREDEYAHE